MDRRSLKLPFSRTSTPDWICPTCGKAPLRIQEDTFFEQERRHSRNHSHDAWDPDWIEYVYSCLLVCTNNACKEVVASSGTGAVDWDMVEDENGVPDQIYEDRFRPKYFQPHLKIFQVPKDCPPSVLKPLDDSFALFFAAPHAASNNVRIAIEALLTEVGVPKFNVAGEKQRFIKLHDRIGLLTGKYEHLKKFLLAIKWLGNAGSHGGEEAISLDDVMDSYELTELILQEIYEPKREKLEQLADKINKQQGPAK